MTHYLNMSTIQNVYSIHDRGGEDPTRLLADKMLARAVCVSGSGLRSLVMHLQRGSADSPEEWKWKSKVVAAILLLSHNYHWYDDRENSPNGTTQFKRRERVLLNQVFTGWDCDLFASLHTSHHMVSMDPIVGVNEYCWYNPFRQFEPITPACYLQGRSSNGHATSYRTVHNTQYTSVRSSRVKTHQANA